MQLRSDNESVYFSRGIEIAKLAVPSMKVIYAVETEHFKEILDFSVAEGWLTTTSADSSLRVFNS